MRTKLQRILYLEDVPEIAQMTLMALRDLGGYEVKHCLNGPDAIDCVTTFDPQLLIFDVMLPGMDGIETLQRIRTQAGNKDLPVIFMTAKAQTHEQASYEALDILGLIMKPFDVTTLCARIEELWLSQ